VFAGDSNSDLLLDDALVVCGNCYRVGWWRWCLVDHFLWSEQHYCIYSWRSRSLYYMFCL